MTTTSDPRNFKAQIVSRMQWAEAVDGRHHWHYDGVALVDRWNGCTMVNPLCPDDLCILPYGHPGMAEGWHHLGTDVGPNQYELAELHPRGPNARPRDLVELGWKRQRELYPDDPMWKEQS